MKVTPIEIIKDMSGKLSAHSNIHIALNHSSGKMFTSKMSHPYEGPASDDQLAQREKFRIRAAYATTWLNDNKPSATNGENGTPNYQLAQKLKKQLQLSNIRQVVCLYMDENGNVNLPGSVPNNNETENNQNSNTQPSAHHEEVL